MTESELDDIAARYRRFAAIEAAGSSSIYERLANAVADHEPALRFLAILPPDRQQPNLLLAAVRWVAGLQAEPDAFFQALAWHEAAIRQVMLTRTTQTNEPARCAVLLPVLARLEQPLALIEVGVLPVYASCLTALAITMAPARYRQRMRIQRPHFPVTSRDRPRCRKNSRRWSGGEGWT